MCRPRMICRNYPSKVSNNHAYSYIIGLSESGIEKNSRSGGFSAEIPRLETFLARCQQLMRPSSESAASLLSAVSAYHASIEYGSQDRNRRFFLTVFWECLCATELGVSELSCNRVAQDGERRAAVCPLLAAANRYTPNN